MRKMIFSFALLAGGCVPRIAATPKTFPSSPIFRPGLEMREIRRDEWLVWAVPPLAQKDAEKAVGCGVCVVESAGGVWHIQRIVTKRAK